MEVEEDEVVLDENEDLSDEWLIEQQRFYTHISDSMRENVSRDERIDSLHRFQLLFRQSTTDLSTGLPTCMRRHKEREYVT